MKLIAVVLAFLAAFAIGCSRQEASDTAADAADTASDVAASAGARAVDTAVGEDVQLKGTAFHPQTLEVKSGQDVTWTNEDAFAHSVVADNGGFTSPTLDQGEKYTFRFTQSGDYPYSCGIHGAAMAGTVKVT